MTQPNDPLLMSRGVRRRLASVEAAAIAGIVCAVGWMLSLNGLLRVPGVQADAADIESYYADDGSTAAAILWLQVLVVSTIAFLWFVGVVRGRLGEREPRLFGTVFFGASIMLALLLFVGASLLAAPAMLASIGDQAPDPGASAITRSAAAVVLSVFAPRIATLVMFSTAGLGRATGALPKWLIWITYILGVVEFLNITVSRSTIFTVPAWIAVVSVVLLVRRPPSGFSLERAVEVLPK
ncbi:MAG: hypothetical protein RL238_3765 [Actinomycetota bacterium]